MKTCSVCAKPLDRRNTSGMCKPHFMAIMRDDPQMRERHREGVRRWAKENPSAVRERSIKIWSKRRANPDDMAAIAERMRTVCQPASATPEARARRDNAARAEAISRSRNPWCPDKYRAEYRDLVKKRGFTGAEARAMIEQQIEADAKRHNPAKLSPFERQERALQAGASLQDNVRVDHHSEDAAFLRAKLA